MNVSWEYVQEFGVLKATSVFYSVINWFPFSLHIDGSQNHLVKIKLDAGTSLCTSVIWWIYTSDFVSIMNKIIFWLAKKDSSEVQKTHMVPIQVYMWGNNCMGLETPQAEEFCVNCMTSLSNLAVGSDRHIEVGFPVIQLPLCHPFFLSISSPKLL